jgi:menaquinone-dependent protoporphyrinogen oxidase
MRVLVTVGSERGGTEGLGEMVAEDLRAEGFQVDLRPPREVRRLDGYDAVVVGGALYALRWHPDARHFVRHHAGELRSRPTWFFSSGPLDDSAASEVIPPVRRVDELMRRVGARGHATFGGRLAPDAKGFPASAMAKKHAGDWRDPVQVEKWAHDVAAELRAAQAGTVAAAG